MTLFADLLAIAFLLVFFLFTLLAPPMRTVFNVTRDSLYEGLFEALAKNGIGYGEPEKVSADRYEMALKGMDASIRIAGIFSTHSITLVFKSSRNIPNFHGFLDDFRIIMQGKALSRRSRHAIGMLILYSLLAFFVVVPILLLLLLR